MALEFDSGEYEFLEQAVELSKNVEGMCVEIGLRKGWGTKVIIDACVEHRPGSTIISIDPFGSILYKPREHMEPCRLDYTNDMYKEVLADMSAYVIGKDVNWLMFKMTDERFFYTQDMGVELYDLEPVLVNKYAMAHFDGPHSIPDIANELSFFNARMDRGAIICVDDCSEDFINVENLKNLFEFNGWELLKMGLKKGIWQKK